MAIKTFGTTITVATNAVGGLTEISNGGVEATIIDVTTHSSADTSREFIGGLRDSGEITLSGHFVYTDVGQDHIRNNIGATAAFEITYSNGNTISGSCVIQSAGESSPLDEAVGFSAVLKVSGKPTYAAS